LPASRQSSRLRQALSELGSSCEFRKAESALLTLGIRASFKTIERISEEVGAELVAEQRRQAAGASADSLAPENPAELLVCEGDGMRVRLREEDAVCSEDEDESPAERESNWREIKVGVVIRGQHGRELPDGTYQDPQTLVQTYVVTLGAIDEFGKLLKSEALRRGWAEAQDRVVLSDAGHGLPGMWVREFGGVRWIIDYDHTKNRLSECAAVIHPPGAAFSKLFGHWEGLLYNGHMDRLLRELVARAEEHAPRPKRPADLEETSPGRILWTNIFYLETYRDHMDYPAYRALGWFIGSGHVEAACKMIGVRMKAANKRWTNEGAHAIAAIIVERTCSDRRWANRWPAPVLSFQEVQRN
jgi:hypothetical protein